MTKNKLSNFQMVLFSAGGLIGGGWLFAPYYSFQTAGIVGALIAWAIIAFVAFVIALSFAEVVSILPIAGAMTRFFKVTHGNSLTFLMVVCGWISYIVLVPLEAQSTIRYLSFWFPNFVQTVDKQVQLSLLGTGLAFLLIIGLTWLNTLVISKVARTNSIATVWKIIVPLGVAVIVIFIYGHGHIVLNNVESHQLSFKEVFSTISKDGLGLSMLGFQNGLLLAKQAQTPKKGVIYSLFIPLIFATIIYMGLSLSFASVKIDDSVNHAIAPLLGLLFFLGIQPLVIILFIDAVIAPMGAGNVYVTFSGRILYGIAHEYFPNSKFTRLNIHNQPAVCLWINAFVACLFLMPFPTWQELANFFASIIAIMYLGGPVALIVLRQKAPNLDRWYRVKFYKLIGYVGFVGCGLLVYWSGYQNIKYLAIMFTVLYVGFILVRGKQCDLKDKFTGLLLIIYCYFLLLVSYLAEFKNLNYLAGTTITVFISWLLCWSFIKLSAADNVIKTKISIIREQEHQAI